MDRDETINIKNKERDSNFELLRIVSMIMIIFHHFAVHSGFEFSTTSITLNRLWVEFIQMGGKIGVNIFILISGYFLINSKNVKISKIFKLWGEIFLYSLGIYIIFVATGLQKFQISSFIKAIFPIAFNYWWFASAYFVLYLISPFINILLNKLDKETYKKMIFILGILWCVIPTFTSFKFQSNSLIWFIFVYSIAGYLKLYGENRKMNNKKCIAICISLIILTYLSVIILNIIGLKIELVANKSTFLYNMQSLPILLISIFMFLVFKNINIKCNKFINLVSKASFGVYLLHDNYYIGQFLWKTLFHNVGFTNSIYLIPYSIFVCCLIFICFSILDIIRIYTIEKIYMEIIYKIEPKINRACKKIINCKLIKEI